jgi:hypothetical protein
MKGFWSKRSNPGDSMLEPQSSYAPSAAEMNIKGLHCLGNTSQNVKEESKEHRPRSLWLRGKQCTTKTTKEARKKKIEKLATLTGNA